MKLNELMPRLQALHHHNQQAVMTISAAIAEVEHGLALLARLGHVYHLESGPPYALEEWPRLLFHVQAAPNGRVVGSWWEALELGPGWWPTLQEAQHKEGVRAQFAGRGGIGDRSLPMLVDGGPAGPRPERGFVAKDNKDRIKEWMDGRRSENALNGGTQIPDRANPQQQSAETATGENLHREPGVGAERPGVNGAEGSLHNTASSTANGISENALQKEAGDGGKQLNGGGTVGVPGVVREEATRAGAAGARANGADTSSV